jgi:N-acetylglutamate synthase-like GNAT family acetyltransferase
MGSEKDNSEDASTHIMASDENGNLVGVCRLQKNAPDQAQLRFMAVKETLQGKGIGMKLIAYAEDKAKQQGAKILILQARETVIEFYKKCGYSVVEKSFLMWDKIQHYLMEKKL